MKTATAKSTPADAVERGRVRAHLGDRGGDALLEHAREEAVQHGRLDRGARRLDRLAAHAQLHRAEDPALGVDLRKRVVDEVARGGLAVGARDADEREPVRRIAVDEGRGLADRFARLRP